jgi:hypothetical protein
MQRFWRPHLLSALPNDGLGLSRQLQPAYVGRQLALRGWHDLLCLLGLLMGFPTRGKDGAALPEYQPHGSRHVSQCKRKRKHPHNDVVNGKILTVASPARLHYPLGRKA